VLEARVSGFFDSVTALALEDLDTVFMQQHAASLARLPHCGYALLKAQVALAALASLHAQPGDVLAFIDCGCTFNASARPTFDAWVAQTLASPSGLLGLQMNI